MFGLILMIVTCFPAWSTEDVLIRFSGLLVIPEFGAYIPAFKSWFIL